TTPDLAEASIKRAFVRAARRVVVLADHTKVGRSDFAKVVDLDDVDLLLTDDALDPHLQAAPTAAGLTVAPACPSPSPPTPASTAPTPPRPSTSAASTARTPPASTPAARASTSPAR